MSTECESIHKLANGLERHNFPFDESNIPMNGIYVFFQKGEEGHHKERIVRIGTHTGDNQIRSRLKQHFLNQNKDRSLWLVNELYKTPFDAAGIEELSKLING